MNIILSMSLAGSMAVLAYYIVKLFLKDAIDVSWRYRMLKAAIFFFLVPVQKLKFNLIDALGLVEEKRFYEIDVTQVIQVQGNERVIYHLPEAFFWISGIWLLMAGLMVFSGTVAYLWQLFRLRMGSIKCDDEQIDWVVFTEKRRLRIKRNVTVRYAKVQKVSLTMGILKPYIIISDMDISEEEKRMLVRHELIHIKQMDSLVKLLAFVVLALNWYNPLAYLLIKEINTVAENVCDRKLVMTMSSRERVDYGRLILNMVTVREVGPLFPVSFSSDGKRVKERIELMLKVKKSRRIFGWLAFLVLAVIGVVSALTIFVYQSPIVVYDGSGEVEFVTEGAVDRIFFAEDMEVVDEFLQIEDSVDAANMERYMEDEKGSFYRIDNSRKHSCDHRWQEGKINSHTKEEDSCVVDIYYAQRCSKCGRIVQSELFSSVSYPKCPH